ELTVWRFESSPGRHRCTQRTQLSFMFSWVFCFARLGFFALRDHIQGSSSLPTNGSLGSTPLTGAGHSSDTIDHTAPTALGRRSGRALFKLLDRPAAYPARLLGQHSFRDQVTDTRADQTRSLSCGRCSSQAEF